MKTRNTWSLSRRNIRAFSLVEVVLAMGVCTVALLGIVGLLGVGLKSSKDSEDKIQAANMASLLISMRTASPTNQFVDLAIPASALTNAYGNAYSGSAVSYLGFDGQLTNAANAVYKITCLAGTNAMTGTGVSQVYLMLSWPPQANPAMATVNRYELLTYISL